MRPRDAISGVRRDSLGIPISESNEEWRPVVGHEGHYEVSSFGSVRSLDRYVKRGSGYARKDGQALKPQINVQSGYVQVALSLDGRRRMLSIHRLVLEAFAGPCPRGMEACHNNGDKQDNRLLNLRWDTPTENNYDLVRQGTHHYAKRSECKWGHPLQPAVLGQPRRCPQCTEDNKRVTSANRTMLRILIRCGLA